jgi:hypothetical protein
MMELSEKDFQAAIETVLKDIGKSVFLVNTKIGDVNR